MEYKTKTFVREWGIPLLIGAGCMGTGLIAGNLKLATVAVDDAAEAAIAKHPAIKRMRYDDLCATGSRITEGKTFAYSGDKVVADKPDCTANLAVVRFRVNVDGIMRDIYLQVRRDAAFSRIITTERPQYNAQELKTGSPAHP